MTQRKIWKCEECEWYTVQFVHSDPQRAQTWDQMHIEELARHRRAVHKKNPLIGLWSKRNASSGVFDKIKKSGNMFKGLRKEN